ncbi:putative linoleate 9S-lipoxygenase 5 [Dorcoceras hygrometricum]|uniref:Putative linoleate 9S-lipoxygenase 5 n=1 Tax=Dorcoceras hygrometricum TaxID=472368 RepID=A0A2Z7B7Z4_9LAMI|nr:putative linoleate 9S-lipoxygenase 5 [Dorcoceras hygrometricum]
MQCIMSCKCMSGTKNIGNNRKAKRTATTTVTHHRVLEATRSHPVENRVAHRRICVGATRQVARYCKWTNHPPTSIQVTATEAYENGSPHPPDALNRGYATPHHTRREELQQSNISWLLKDSMAQYAMQMKYHAQRDACNYLKQIPSRQCTNCLLDYASSQLTAKPHKAIQKLESSKEPGKSAKIRTSTIYYLLSITETAKPHKAIQKLESSKEPGKSAKIRTSTIYYLLSITEIWFYYSTQALQRELSLKMAINRLPRSSNRAEELSTGICENTRNGSYFAPLPHVDLKPQNGRNRKLLAERNQHRKSCIKQ